MARVYLRPLNPIALREMKSRMRGPRTFALLAVYMMVLAGFIFTVYVRKGAGSIYNYGGNLVSGNFGPTRNFETGQDIFISIFLYLIVVSALVTPAVCGGLVSREIEESTYDMLLVTPVRGRSLIYGKLVAALGYLALLLLAALPISCIVFFFGGVSIEHIVAGYAIVLLQTVVLGILSLFFSGLLRRTSLAVIVTYSLAAILLLGVPIVSTSIVAAINSDTTRPGNTGRNLEARVDPAFDPPKRLLVLNPFAALGSVLAPNAPYRPGSNQDLQFFPNSKLYWGSPDVYYSSPFSGTNPDAGRLYAISKLPALPYNVTLWQCYLLVYTAVGLFFLILSFGVVKPQSRRPGINLLKPLFKRTQSQPRRRSAKNPSVAPPVDAEATAAPPSPVEPDPAPALADKPQPLG